MTLCVKLTPKSIPSKLLVILVREVGERSAVGKLLLTESKLSFQLSCHPTSLVQPFPMIPLYYSRSSLPFLRGPIMLAEVLTLSFSPLSSFSLDYLPPFLSFDVFKFHLSILFRILSHMQSVYPNCQKQFSLVVIHFILP
jgi:hypothetical protein